MSVTIGKTGSIYVHGETLADRIAAHVEVSPAGCWEWRGATTNGYGRIQVGRQAKYTHRVSYELRHGTIPPGMQVDHLCRNTICCNPDHLDVVTPLENKTRAIEANGTDFCLAGHRFDDLNTAVVVDAKGYNHRVCRTCRKDRVRRWRQSKAAKC